MIKNGILYTINKAYDKPVLIKQSFAHDIQAVYCEFDIVNFTYNEPKNDKNQFSVDLVI